MAGFVVLESLEQFICVALDLGLRERRTINIVENLCNIGPRLGLDSQLNQLYLLSRQDDV